MFFEEFDYWIIKLFGPPYAYIGLSVLKKAKNYTQSNETPLRFVPTTLDLAYLEKRKLNVKIDKNDPFYIQGDFGGKFAVYGEWELEEGQITKHFGYEMNGDGFIHRKVDRVMPSICWLYSTGKGKVRRLSLSERKLLSL